MYVRKIVFHVFLFSVCLIAGYSFGYKDAYHLQNLNLRIDNVQYIQTLDKLEKLLNSEEIDRASRMVEYLLESKKAHVGELQGLRAEFPLVLFPSISDFYLKQHLFEKLKEDEKGIIKI